VSLSVVLGIAAFLVLPVDTTPTQRNPLGSLANALGATGGGGLRGNAYYSAGRLDMRVRGTLSDRPVIEVPADSPQLWRSQVFPFYDGLAWSADRGRESVPGPPWVVARSSAVDRTDRVVIRGRSDGTIWAPGTPVVVDAEAGPGLVVDRLGVPSVAGPISDYTVTSTPSPLDAAVLRAAPSAPAASRWLQLPAALPDRVGALSAELTAAAATPYDAVLAIEAWLRANLTYRLDSPVPARAEDAVDRFLFVDRTGFCEQFAAAETVLLRAAGIPARLVTGLAVGAPADRARRLYREKDLHAWVEVFYPGVGWSPSDPTAGVPLAAGAGGSVRQRITSAVDGALRFTESVPGGRLTLALLLLVVATGIVALSGVRLPPAQRAGQPVPSARGRPGPALAAFLRYDARLGERRRRPAESLAELAARLGPGPAGALAVVEAECYAPSPPADAVRAAAVLDSLQPVGAGPDG
jgi:transglutaminase-like putative cysteine protease